MEAQRTMPMYKADCRVARSKDNEEIFPGFFSLPPKTGDLVQSQSGKIFRISNIVHAAKITKGKYGDIQSPVATLVLEPVKR